MGVKERIEQRAKEIYKDRYGKRRESDLSTQELEKVVHDAAIEVQKEIKQRKE